MTKPAPALPPIRVLLIARPGAAREIYAEALQQAGAQVDVAAGIEDLHAAVTLHPYHGVVVDIPTKIQALRDHKELVNSILGSFPVIQVNVDPATGRIRAMCFGARQVSGRLEDFIARECRQAVPRMFRRHPRTAVQCHVRLQAAGAPPGARGERTAALNLSEGGCFIFTARRYAVGDEVRMAFQALDPRRPLRGVVRHRVAWGRDAGLPGIGVEFIGLNGERRRALRELVAPTGGTPPAAATDA